LVQHQNDNIKANGHAAGIYCLAPSYSTQLERLRRATLAWPTDQLSALLALLGLAVALAAKTGVAPPPRRPIPLKKHGRRPGLSFSVPEISMS
jgi:hypothetical protein